LPGRCPERVRAAARAGLVAYPLGRRPACGGAREQGKDFADGPLAAGGLWQRQMLLDLVAVAAAVLALADVARYGQVGHDAGGAAFGDARPGRDVAQPHPRVACQEQQHPAVVTQEGPAAQTRNATTVSRKKLLVQVADVGWGQAPWISRRRRPGTRRHWKERAMILIGLVIIIIAVLMMVVVSRIGRKL
jgi:hypothetical protein